MIEADRVLQPLDEAGSAIERLERYETPSDLADAIGETQRAVDRTLRLFLRSDPEAPDDARLNAFAPATPRDAVIVALRQRERISMTLAGRLHELDQAAERAARGAVRAADGDVVHAVVRSLREEVRAAAERPVRDVAHNAVTTGALEDAPREVPPPRRRRPLALIAGALVLAAVVVAAALLLTRTDALDEGVRAFDAGRLGIAERHLSEVVADDSSNVTALLYLGRIYRREGRHEDARNVLQRAARTAPRDADVQRELGWFLLDLNAPASAVRHFRIAQELEPNSTPTWIGLIRALRAANDPSANEWLARAPAEVRAALTPAPQP